MKLKESSTRILLALYRHEIMTPLQLAVYTNYHIDYIYKAVSALAKEQLVNKHSVPFIFPTAKAYFLTHKSYEWVRERVKESERERPKTWEQPTGNVLSNLLSNQFYTELIAKTKNDYSSGLLEWLGKKDAGDKYADFNEKEQRTVTYAPQAYSVIQLKGGRAVVNMEVLTGDETIAVLEDYIIAGIKALQAYCQEDTPRVSMLFLCLTPTIIPPMLEVCESVKDRLPGVKPMIGVALFNDVIKQGVLSDVWIMEDGKRSLYDCAAFEPNVIHPSQFIGKHMIPQFSSIGAEFWEKGGVVRNKGRQDQKLEQDTSDTKEDRNEPIFYG